jgi:hypothetical protein
MPEVWLSYAKALGHITCNFLLAFSLVFVFHRYSALHPSHWAQSLLTLGGTFCLLTAGLGKLGWAIQSWGGTTPPEVLNHNLFLVISHVGMLLIFTEWCWSIWGASLGPANGVKR